MNHFGYVLDDVIPCTVCGRRAVDIHHISAIGMGGSNSKDFIENLAALCRNCHMKAEYNKEFNSEVKQKHLKLL